MMIRSIAHPLMLLFLTAVSSGRANAQSTSFTGIVVPNNVEIRAGAGRAYYFVGNLHKGDIVQVEDVIFGWDKIVSPPGVYSYVPKAFVDAKGDGHTGVANGDRILVKAASVKGPGESYKPQVRLNKGDQVEIIGAEGDYYKIKPPKGSFVFLPPGSVRHATPAQIADYKARVVAASKMLDQKPQRHPQGTTNPAVVQQSTSTSPTARVAQTTRRSAPLSESTTQTTTAKPAQADANTTVNASVATSVNVAKPDPAESDEADHAQQPDQAVVSQRGVPKLSTTDKPTAAAEGLPEGLVVHPVSPQLKQLETRMTPLFKQPLEKQPLSQMIAAYQVVKDQSLPAADQRIVAMRLATLRRNQQIAHTLKEIEKAQNASASTSPKHATNVQAMPQIPAPAHGLPGAPIHYDAVGRLMASSVYDGVNLPRMFRVIDPASGRTLAWVAPGDKVSAHYLGKLVGVIGPKNYDPALKFNVLSVKQLDLLQPVQPQNDKEQQPLAANH